MSSMSESPWWYCIYCTKKWRAETLQPVLEFDNFKPRLKSGIFKCISWLNGSFFWGWWSGSFESGNQYLANGTSVASQLTTFMSVFTSIVYGRDVTICSFSFFCKEKCPNVNLFQCWLVKLWTWTMGMKTFNIFFLPLLISIFNHNSLWRRAVYIWVELEACQ
jgi:hypothetical protein